MRFVSVLASMLLSGLTAAAAGPVISEFMASNATTWKDGHGNYEDWVEIWNPDATSINLSGWRLTDSASNGQKFVFPPRILAAGGRVVIVCSGRTGSADGTPHIDPQGYWHAPFSLAKSGEYLALIQPDGATKASEFAPAYPPQVTDLSYGSRAAIDSLINASTAVKFLAPTTAAPDTAVTNWRAPAFNDASWRSGTGSGTGFEQGSPVGVWLLNEPAGTTEATDASGSGHTATPNGVGPVFGAASPLANWAARASAAAAAALAAAMAAAMASAGVWK